MIEFNETTHTYTLEGKVLISTTQLLSKYGLVPSYEYVNKETLNKSAEFGRFVHKEIENYIKKGEIGWSDQLHLFVDYVRSNGNMTDLLSETIVHNEHIAGTIDLIYKKEGYTYIGDFKTTYSLNTHAVSWQLSIYAYLYDKENYENTKIQCFHFTKDRLDVIELKLIAKSEVERLFESYINNTDFIEGDDVIPLALSAELNKLETAIVNYELELKRKKEEEKALLEKIKLIMEINGVKKCTCGKVDISYFEEATKKTIDTARLREEMPDVVEKYERTSKISSYIKIKIKEDK